MAALTAYKVIGSLFALLAFIGTSAGLTLYCTASSGWLLGGAFGLLVGIFFGAIAAGITFVTWPLIIAIGIIVLFVT